MPLGRVASRVLKWAGLALAFGLVFLALVVAYGLATSTDL
jgi:hypothetical protein